ncbi:phage regulatory CII family protein [Melaminivora sp.]|uniref:phage regulatory CII family protein n=1 Tax=Melaminivora sp. TaxID=1933032 RepID=UPI0028A67A44|nr:phage regulatory CII family protein [Melaminivora sp.]
MNLLDAARRTVRHYPGGLEAMALRLQKQPGTLDRELRGAPGYKLGATDAAEIAQLAMEQGGEHALAYPNALADALGALLVVLPGNGPRAGASALDVAALMRECAGVVESVAGADADGRITGRELAEIERHWADTVAAGQQMLRNLQHRHAEQLQRHRDAVEAAR